MEREEQRFAVRFFWLKGWGSKEIHQELMGTPGDDAYGCLKSKSRCRGSEPGIFSTMTFLVWDDHPSLWDRTLRHFSKSIVSQMPA
jgi:hypothetical protein